MATHKSRYPELDIWWHERLFVRRQFHGDSFGVGRQQWYITRIREMYFDGGQGQNLNRSSGGPSIPYVESQGWRKAKIIDGFRYVHNKDIRGIMAGMILNDTKEQALPSARAVAKSNGYRWPQFVQDFTEGLWEMYNAGVARGL